MADADIELPTDLATRYVRYVVGFAVAVGAGLAPFLGVVKIPGYQALLEIFDDPIDRETLIPFSSFLMGVIAVAVQFYSGERIRRRAIRRRFTAALVTLLIGFFALFSLYEWRVVHVSFLDLPDQPLVRVLGWARSDDCPCPETETIEQCLENLANEPGLCWPGGRGVKLSMELAYLLLTGGFAAIVGLLILQEERVRQDRRSRSAKHRRPAAETPPPAPPTPDDSGPPPREKETADHQEPSS